jgi:hypothetical protein
MPVQNIDSHRWLAEDILTDGPIQNIAYYLQQTGQAGLVKSGLAINLPASGNPGSFYYATDTLILYESTGGAFTPTGTSPRTSEVEVWDHIADHPTGALTGLLPDGSLTGLWLTGAAAAAQPVIAGGKLTIAAAGASVGSYPEILLKNPAKRIGARWTFSATATPGNGTAALAVWAVDIAGTFPTIPNTPIHLAITAGGWIYGYYLGNALTVLAQGLFTPPLIADGITVYTADIYIDRAKGQAILFLPDGSSTVVADSHITSIIGLYACWETYTNLSTDALVGYTDVWADSLSFADLGVLAVVRPPSLGGPNLLTLEDSSLEAGTTGAWAALLNCTISNDATHGADGTHSLKLTASAAAQGEVAVLYPIQPDTVYTVSASWLAGTVPAVVFHQFTYLNAAQTYISSSGQGQFISDGIYGWTQTSLTAQSPPLAAFAYVQCQVNFASIGEIHYLDRIALNQGFGIAWNPGTGRNPSGAMPTTTFASGTGKQILTTRDVTLTTPITLTPTAGATATVLVALSPDNLTYSGVGTYTAPIGTTLDSFIELDTRIVPAGWWIKFTATNASTGTATYY